MSPSIVYEFQEEFLRLDHVSKKSEQPWEVNTIHKGESVITGYAEPGSIISVSQAGFGIAYTTVNPNRSWLVNLRITNDNPIEIVQFSPGRSKSSEWTVYPV